MSLYFDLLIIEELVLLISKISFLEEAFFLYFALGPH